jgi:hypothetical protein
VGAVPYYSTLNVIAGQGGRHRADALARLDG